ncbi:MAG TPA: hypothetical protein VG325_05315 [Solirubrobacteraceae bacterium]|nr:hypothetical protein [Solirubrobacteraceae bacterium]
MSPAAHRRKFGVLISSYAGILAATVAFMLLMVAGFTSARIAWRCTHRPATHAL